MTTRLSLLLAAATLSIAAAAAAQTAPARTTPAQSAPAQNAPTQSMRPRADADGNGMTSRAEARAAAEGAFARFDVDRDSRLTSADREQMRTVRRAQRFARMDNDNDGSISRAEWDIAQQAMEARMQAQRGPGGPGAPEARDGEDGPGDDGPGMRRHHGRHGHHGMRDGGMRVPGNGIDADRDGAVSREEFIARAMSHFDRTDANHDGNVTAAERTSARAARMDRRVAPPVPGE